MKAIVLLVIAILLEFGAAIETRYLAFHETGYLPCVHDTNPKVLLVRWFKTTAQDETLVALWSSLEGESINTENYSIDKKNFTLIINGTREENEGDFYCYVVYLRSPASTYNVRLELADEDASLPSTTASRAPFSTQTTEVTSNTTGYEGKPDLIKGLTVGPSVVGVVVGVVLVAVAVAVAAGLKRSKTARAECSRSKRAEHSPRNSSTSSSSSSSMVNPGKGTVHENRLKELSKNLRKDRDTFIQFFEGREKTSEESQRILDSNTSGGDTDFEKSYHDVLMTGKKHTRGAYKELAAALIDTISEDLLKGKVPCNRSRIMVVGPAGVGKTSFINRLTNQSFGQEEKSTVGTVNTHTTIQWKLETVPRDELAECLARHQNASREERNFKNHPSRERLAMASKVDGQQLQGLVCPLCLDVFKNATLLSCGHTFCRECLKACYEQYCRDHVVCPVCRTTTELDELAECLARHQNASREERNFEVVKTTSHRSLPTTERVSSQGVQDDSSEPNEGSEEVKEYAKSISAERIHNVTSSANDIIYNIWDFGGQEIYYITHPLFLSWRSLYIAVFPLHKIITENALREEDISTGQMEGCPTRTYRTMLDLMHFWMMSIHIHAVPPHHMKVRGDPKILLVGTFCNDDKSKSNKEMSISKLQIMIRDKPYSSQVISSVVEVDNKSSSDDEISQIQRKIDDLIKDADYMKEEFPIKWRIFLDKTKDLHQDTLKLTEARKIMNEIGIRDDKEVQDVLKFCHDAAHLIYHQGCELIILHPEVLNSFVSNIITVITPEKLHGDLGEHWMRLQKKGVLSMDLIKAVWKQHEGKDDELDMLISMMIKFDLVCEIHDTQGVYQGRHFFVPCRSSPTLHLEEQHGSDDQFQFIIDFRHLLPDGFLHRLYVRMAKWAMDQGGPENPSFHCREMLFYIDERHCVIMSNNIEGGNAHKIKVTICALSAGVHPDPNAKVNLQYSFMKKLDDTLEELKKTWARRITYVVGIECPKCHKIVRLAKFRCYKEIVPCDNCSCPIRVSEVPECIRRGHAAATSTLTGASSQNPEDLGGSEVGYRVKPDKMGRYRQDMKPAKPSDDELNDNKRYGMNANPKGLLFLFNMTKDRPGSEVDFDNIKHVFGEIGYEIESHINLKLEELKEKLQTFVNQERHKDMCSVVFVLMGHGNKSGIRCFDGKKVTTKFVRDTVYKMDSMLGKPKMIFYQMCRKGQGETSDDDDDDDGESDGSDSDIDVQNESDVLLAYATTEGHPAKRGTKSGSWFIRALCKILLERAHKDDLCSMLDQVTEGVKNKPRKRNRQNPVIIKQGISKKIFFLPKYPPQNESP